MPPSRTPAAIFDAAAAAWRPWAAARYSPERVDRVIASQRARLIDLIEDTMRKQGREAPPPWWQRTPGLPRVHDLAVRDEARALLEAVRAYVNDPEWSLLDEEDAAATIHEAIVPHWPLDDAERLIQAVADLDGGLRDEDSFLEELTAALRDGHAPDARDPHHRSRHRLRLRRPATTATYPTATDAAYVHALAARWRGQIAAVALAGAPTGRWGRDQRLPARGHPRNHPRRQPRRPPPLRPQAAATSP
jgi:hypothetical protein